MKRRRPKSPSSTASKGGKQASQRAGPKGGSRPAISTRKLWLFRAAAVVLAPVIFFLAVELCLRVADYGHPMSFFLPTTIKNQKMLVQNDRFAWRFFGPEVAREPWPLAIPRTKAAGTIRVFVFGESAAFGDPQPEFGLSRMLEALLSGRFPDTRFEVVNTAMTAINSHAILPIARDCASQAGDVWVIYMGNNEVVGPYGAGTVFGSKTAGLALIRASLALKATRTGQWLGSILGGLKKQPLTKQEWGGMQMFISNQVREDDARMANVYANFKQNLADILRAGKAGGAKMVVSTVAANLKDCAPFGSLHRPDLTANDLQEWNRIYQKGAEAEQAGKWADAIEQYRQAEKTDATYAELHFRRGRCCLALGQEEEARKQFTLALDQDTLRFRADTRINDIIRQGASGREREGIELVDASDALARLSPHGLLGQELLYEHVHLTFEGNYALALRLADRVAIFLPESLTRGPGASRSWPSVADCARRLGWTDYSRFAGEMSIIGRLNDPPFATQLNHREEFEWLSHQMESVLPSAAPPALPKVAFAYQEALKEAPDDWVLYKQLAELQQQTGKLAAAADSWRRVTELLPLDKAGWRGLGVTLAEDNHLDEAMAAFQQTLKLDPGAVETINAMAQLWAIKGKNEEAVKEYEAALRIKPYWGPAHLGLGKLLESMGKTNEAQPHFEEALKNRMLTPEAMNALAKFCFSKGWYEKAVTNFTDALKLNPSDAVTHVNLGVTLEELGRYQEAQRHFAEAVRLQPTLPDAHARLGSALGRAGDDAGALREFTEALKLQPDLLAVRINVGIAMLKQNRAHDALEQFQEVLHRDPTNAAALQWIQAVKSSTPAVQPH